MTFMRIITTLFFLPIFLLATERVTGAETIVVTAVGLADLDSDAYKKDRSLAIDAAREDAKRKAIEKAVGTQVESSTMVKNYVLIEDKILTKSSGLIKKVLEESSPWKDKNGFLNVEIKAEVFLSQIRDALVSMSEMERIDLLKRYGNPRISVAVFMRDSDDSGKIERSTLAENLLSERIKAFGYRVWSEENAEKLRVEMFERSQIRGHSELLVDIAHLKNSDFYISGEVKFEKRSVTLKSSGIKVSSYFLNSWTVSCVDSSTGEAVYYNNKIPKTKPWNNQDQAMEEVGKLIGNEFSQDFFEKNLMRPSRIYQVEILGLPSYGVAEVVKKEMAGLRPILNIDLRDFNAGSLSTFEIEFTGERNNFVGFLHSAVVEPLNKKFGKGALKLESASGKTLRFSFQSDVDPEDFHTDLEQS
jgi:hypothetical protein